MNKNKPVIALTAGDINGVGCEVLLKALEDEHILEICRPVVYGNMKVLRFHAETLGEERRAQPWAIISDPKEARDGKLNLINCYPDDTPVQLGQSTPQAGAAALASLQRACADIKAGCVDALVTAPINKDTIQSPSFPFTGHTEYLTAQFAAEGQDSLMMMVSDRMKVALVCNHTPISELCTTITQERILAKLRVLNASLRDDFHIRRPRIAVLALNPHAGDNGLIGHEEQDIIRPALEQANSEGMWTFGPYPADGFFGAGRYIQFDAVLAMYHDQGLIPFKSLDMSGVNYTAGLSVIRTSPDHGTAYDIAGKNQANAESMLHALYMAIDLVALRRETRELNANPLKIEERPVRPPKPMFAPAAAESEATNPEITNPETESIEPQDNDQ